jgi:phosphate starvation-inducible membrane PsiE
MREEKVWKFTHCKSVTCIHLTLLCYKYKATFIVFNLRKKQESEHRKFSFLHTLCSCIFVVLVCLIMCQPKKNWISNTSYTVYLLTGCMHMSLLQPHNSSEQVILASQHVCPYFVLNCTDKYTASRLDFLVEIKPRLDPHVRYVVYILLMLLAEFTNKDLNNEL